MIFILKEIYLINYITFLNLIVLIIKIKYFFYFGNEKLIDVADSNFFSKCAQNYRNVLIGKSFCSINNFVIQKICFEVFGLAINMLLSTKTKM